jgi:hypothetical protein
MARWRFRSNPVTGPTALTLDQPLPGHRLKRLQLRLVVSRTQMLDAPRTPQRRPHIRTAIAAATDLIAWAKLIRFTDQPPSRAARGDVPLPCPARRRPHHPQRPTTAPTYRRHLPLGAGDYRRLALDPHRLPLTPRSLTPLRRDERPTGPRKPAHRSDTHHTGMPQSAPPVGQNQQHPPRSGRAKNRG